MQGRIIISLFVFSLAFLAIAQSGSAESFLVTLANRSQAIEVGPDNGIESGDIVNISLNFTNQIAAIGAGDVGNITNITIALPNGTIIAFRDCNPEADLPDPAAWSNLTSGGGRVRISCLLNHNNFTFSYGRINTIYRNGRHNS